MEWAGHYNYIHRLNPWPTWNVRPSWFLLPEFRSAGATRMPWDMSNAVHFRYAEQARSESMTSPGAPE